MNRATLVILLGSLAPACSEPSPAPNPDPTVLADPGFLVGQHFHGVPGYAEAGPVVHRYNVVRTLNHDPTGDGGVQGTRWWIGNDQYDFTGLDTFINYHAANGARVILTISSTPTWASSRPDEYNHFFPGLPGGLAPPADLASFGRMVEATVSRYGSKLAAVECWNEPFGSTPDHKEFFTGSQTDLADICKALHRAVKNVDPGLPVIGPAQAYFNPPIILDARTSQGEPIADFFDWFGYHGYDYTGPVGVGWSHRDLGAELDRVRAILDSYGLTATPIILTESGYHHTRTSFCALSSQQRAEVLYDNARTAYEKGARGYVFYSYDSTADALGSCGFGGIATAGHPPFDGNFTPYSYDAVVASGIDRAFADFGGRGGDHTPSTVRVEAGGATHFDADGNKWEADRGFVGGGTADRGAIEIAGTSNPAIYRTERWGVSRYALPVATGTYDVRLHFAETYDGITAAGQRVFDVDVEGHQLLGVDVFAEAGGARRALVKTVTVQVTDGVVDIGFAPRVQSAMISAIEILPARTELRVDSGASAPLTDAEGRHWEADRGFAGGGTADRGAIAIAGTTTPGLYRSERWGVERYALPVGAGTYEVRLHFAETYAGVTGAGQRVFSVDVEGTTIPQLDVFAEAGGANRALVKRVTVPVVDGTLDLRFTAHVQSPMISAIEVIPVE